MKLLHGFSIPSHLNKIPDLILLPDVSRRCDLMAGQTEQSYRGYLHFKLKQLKIANKKLADECWTDRTDNQVAQMNHYRKEIQDIEDTITCNKWMDNLELEKEND